VYLLARNWGEIIGTKMQTRQTRQMCVRVITLQDGQANNLRDFDRSLPLGNTMIKWHRHNLAMQTLLAPRLAFALAITSLLFQPQSLFGQFGYGLLPPTNQQRQASQLPVQPPPANLYPQPNSYAPTQPGTVPAQQLAMLPRGMTPEQARMMQTQQPGQPFPQQFMNGQIVSQYPSNYPPQNQFGPPPTNYPPNPQQFVPPQYNPQQFGPQQYAPQQYAGNRNSSPSSQLSQYMQQPTGMDLYPQNPGPVASWPDQSFQQVSQFPPTQQSQSYPTSPALQAQPGIQAPSNQNGSGQSAPNGSQPQQPNWVAAPYRAPDPQSPTTGTEAQFTSSSNTLYASNKANDLNAKPAASMPTARVSSSDENKEQVFEGGRLLAVVGEEPILLGDLLPLVDAKLAELEGKIPPKQRDIARQQLTRRALQDQIVTKCLAQKFVRDTVGVKPQKDYAEFRKTIMPRTTKVFYTQYIPGMMKRQKVETEQELDDKLREMGTSIAAQHASFADSVLADEVIKSNVPKEPRIDLEELRDYYEANIAEYQMPAKAKWRQLTVLYSNHPSKEAAAKVISDMGNEILFGGTNFEAVAKKMSEGTTASKGGVFDWTTQGALKSTVLDENIFQLPVNRLSRIIEDEAGYHIIEVTERQDARTVSFAEAQIEIRKTLQEKRQTELRKEFVEKVRKETPVWSLWPQDMPDSRPLSELISETGAGAE
jgi:PPIC-type PPIASE domain